jgi:16S rRNA (cytosine967-C5)-methyltransferase
VSPRALTALVVVRVAREGHTLDETLAAFEDRAGTRDRALVQAMSYAVLRWLPRLAAITDHLLRKPLKARDKDIWALILVGLVQLLYLRVPAHAAIAATVEAAREFRKPWAAGLVNGVLRRFQREREALLARVDRIESARYAHPPWLIERLRADWPRDWQAICAANNAHPPMSLRVNRRKRPREAYLDQLANAGVAASPARHVESGVVLAEPMGVERLPGFAAGEVSVQDVAAQLAAKLLDLGPGQRVLDACAAPGGKTGHLLEREPALAQLVAIDRDGIRLQRLAANLARLDLTCELLAADATDPRRWWDGTPFDRILIDVPCSATGVIRRHPDIKTLRRPEDMEGLTAQQSALLTGLWPLLAPGGRLLYVTCSVLRAENEERIAAFLRLHGNGVECPMEADWGRPCRYGRQILPGDDGMDGFYYAALIKRQANGGDTANRTVS